MHSLIYGLSVLPKEVASAKHRHTGGHGETDSLFRKINEFDNPEFLDRLLFIRMGSTCPSQLNAKPVHFDNM